MKTLEGIFEILDGILPIEAEKTVIFCEIEENAYEIYYYSFFADGACKQCYELVDEDCLDSIILENGFERLANYIRECDSFSINNRNVVTITIEGTSKKVSIEQFDKNVGLYKIKKDWKTINLCAK